MISPRYYRRSGKQLQSAVNYLSSLLLIPENALGSESILTCSFLIPMYLMPTSAQQGRFRSPGCLRCRTCNSRPGGGQQRNEAGTPARPSEAVKRNLPQPPFCPPHPAAFLFPRQRGGPVGFRRLSAAGRPHTWVFRAWAMTRAPDTLLLEPVTARRQVTFRHLPTAADSRLARNHPARQPLRTPTVRPLL